MRDMQNEFDSLVTKTPLSDGLDRRHFMKTALGKGKSKSQFVVYQDSGHAFHADYRPSYVEADAKDAWKRCLDWFETHGVL